MAPGGNDNGKAAAARVLQSYLEKRQQQKDASGRQDDKTSSGSSNHIVAQRQESTSSATSEDAPKPPSKHTRRASNLTKPVAAAAAAVASKLSFLTRSKSNSQHGLHGSGGSDSSSKSPSGRHINSTYTPEVSPISTRQDSDSTQTSTYEAAPSPGFNSAQPDAEPIKIINQQTQQSLPPEPEATAVPPAKSFNGLEQMLRIRQKSASSHIPGERQSSTSSNYESAPLDMDKTGESLAATVEQHMANVQARERQDRAEEFRAATSLPPISIDNKRNSAVEAVLSARHSTGSRVVSHPPSLSKFSHSSAGTMRSIDTRPPGNHFHFAGYGPSFSGPKDLNHLGEGIQLALDFISASDKDIRVHAGEAIAQLLKDCSSRDIHKIPPEGKDNATFKELTKDEMSALKVLAMSRAPSLRNVAANVLGEYASRSGFPRGPEGLNSFLAHATELVKSSECALQIFAVRIAIDFAAKGTIWQGRLLERHWFKLIVGVVEKTLTDAGRPRRLNPYRTDSPRPAVGDDNLTTPHGGASHASTGSEADDDRDEDGSSSRHADQTERTRNFSEEQRRLLKLAFEFIGKLDLEEAERSMKSQSDQHRDLLEEVREGRKDLINLLTDMCIGSNLHVHISLLKLLFNAFVGLVRNLTRDHWQDGLEEQFIDRALGIILERAEEAAQQHQSLASAILSQSMMQGDADDTFPDMYDDTYNDNGFVGGYAFQGDGASMQPPTPPPPPPPLPSPTGMASPSGVQPVLLGRSGTAESMPTLTQLQLQQQQLYRQNSMLTSSTMSYSSVGGGGGYRPAPTSLLHMLPRAPLMQSAELAANESKWAQAQRNAQQSSQLLVKKLHLVALTMAALEVVQQACASSRAIANATAEMFEMRGVMRVLNMLYRSDVPGAKAQIARFLCTLCENVTDRHKVHLCESGVIVRLLRLASPSSVYGKKSPGGLASSDEAAYLPSIKALTFLAQVDVIGARIVIAGGVGPLYSHANSTRDTRMAAKEALEVLGVGNVNDLVEVWTAHRRKGAFRELQDDEYLTEDKQVEEDDGETLGNEDLVGPQPLNVSSHSSGKSGKSTSTKRLGVMEHASSNLSNGSRRRQVMVQRSNSVNSTRPFYEPSEAQAPRVQRVTNLLTKWRRADGSGLLVRLNSLRGDAQGKTPFKKTVTLGSGAFSTVYKAFMVRDDMSTEDPENADLKELSDEKNVGRYIPVAVKRLTDAAFADNAFLNEIKIMSKLPAHRHICNLHAVAMAENTAFIISEMGGPQTLAAHLASANEHPDSVSPLCKSWVARLKVAIGIAEALKALQSLNPIIVHLDLKSSNVLLTDLGGGRYVPKLCDFGLAIELKTGMEFLSPANHGTLQYMAPEVLRDEEVELAKGFDQAADTYSFAIVLWDMAHPGRVPWDELAVDTNLDSIQERIREMVLSQRRPTRYGTSDWPKDYERLMRSCWRHKPEDRPLFVRSFLTDPDSLTFAPKALSKDGDTVQETIVTTLKRILWDYKSARRVRESLARHGEARSSDLRHSRPRHRGSHDQADTSSSTLLPGRREPKLRRQSSILGHRHLPQNFQSSVDYHDHDDDEAYSRDLSLSSRELLTVDSFRTSSNALASMSPSNSLLGLGESLGVSDTALSDQISPNYSSDRLASPARRIFRRQMSNSVDEGKLASNSSRKLNSSQS